MPTSARYLIIDDDSYFHVTWQCHNKDWLLAPPWAKKLYCDLLLKYKDKYGVQINAYNFMDNHPHLVGHLNERKKFSDFFRIVNGLFARGYNKRMGRRGQVVMDRFKSPKIESDKHMLTVMSYVDLNQYRAKKVEHPDDNRWSSYRYYAYGEKDPLITPSPSYLELGSTSEKRQSEYRLMVDGLLEKGHVINISNTCFIGDPDWVIEKYKQLKIALKDKSRRTRGPPPPDIEETTKKFKK